MKAFSNSLEPTPNIKFLRRCLSHVEYHSDKLNKNNIANIFMHFYEALEIKYPNIKTTQMISIKSDIFHKAFTHFSDMKSGNSIVEKRKEEFYTILNYIVSNDNALDLAFESIKSMNLLNLCKIFNQHTKNNHHVDCINSVFYDKLSQMHSTNVFKFEQCSEDLKKILIEESKEQFFPIDEEHSYYDISDDELPF